MTVSSKKLFTVKNMAITAMLSALAIVLYQIIELPLNPFAPFLKVNFSDIPAVVAGLVISPVSGIIVTLIRCVAHLLRTSTFGIGEIADFVVGAAIVIVFCSSQNYFKEKSNYSALKANAWSVAATFAAAVVAGFIINLIVYPIYMMLIGEGIKSSSALVLYLAATAITNTERIVLNIGLCMFILPFIPRFKTAVNSD